MRQLLAILKDSFRETLDRKLLILLIFLTSLPILFCFSISFEREPLERTLRESASRINRLPHYGHGPHRMRFTSGLKLTVDDVSPVDDAEDWPAEVRGGHVVELTFSEPGQLDTLVKGFQRWLSGRPRRRQEQEAPEEAATVEQKIVFLKERFEHFGFDRVYVTAVGQTEERFRVAVKGSFPHEIQGAHRLSLLFGIFESLPFPTSIAEFTVRLQQGLAAIFAGFIVMVIAILTTASFIPDMLRKGSLDLLLARPIGRVRLLLYKYVGGLWFIALFSTVLITGCWIGISLRTGYWNPWFLLSIPIVSVIFAVLYAVSVLVGVCTRSAGASALIAFGVWGVSSIIVGIHHVIRTALFGAEVPPILVTIFDVFYTILPKTQDLILLNTYALSRSHLSPQAYVRTFGRELPEVDWVFSLGTTAGFTLLVLALAAWWFRRRDY